MRLHVNVDHVATLRQARGTTYPDPVEAALACEKAGAHGITVHLREDRRHIQDHDVRALRLRLSTFLNLEMAATDEMIRIAIDLKPDLVTLVPERRQERTTEGGLDVIGQRAEIAAARARLGAAGIPVSLFVAPDPAQIDASKAVMAKTVELHTGEYAHAWLAAAGDGKDVRVERELGALATAATQAARLGLELAAGHGLTVGNVGALLVRVPEIDELNIGHAIVADAVLVGMERAVHAMHAAMSAGAAARTTRT